MTILKTPTQTATQTATQTSAQLAVDAPLSASVSPGPTVTAQGQAAFRTTAMASLMTLAVAIPVVMAYVGYTIVTVLAESM
jgi:hypothetical protein